MAHSAFRRSWPTSAWGFLLGRHDSDDLGLMSFFTDGRSIGEHDRVSGETQRISPPLDSLDAPSLTSVC